MTLTYFLNKKLNFRFYDENVTDFNKKCGENFFTSFFKIFRDNIDIWGERLKPSWIVGIVLSSYGHGKYGLFISITIGQ